MFIAQATQPVTAEQWSDVKMALAGLAVLVIGTLGMVLVGLLKKGGSALEAMLEARAASKTASEAKSQSSAAEAKSDVAITVGQTNARNINEVSLATKPPGTGDGGQRP